MTEVTHVISRCVDCQQLTKMRMQQFCEGLTSSYLMARVNDESEIVVRCPNCHKKVAKHG